MSNKEKILDLYYNQHLKQNEIAKIVDTTTQYVSKVVRTDKRNIEEKEKRKKENSENRKIYLQEYFKTYNRPKKDDNSYEQMIAQQIQDSMELSFSNSNISDYAFVKWNSSAYHTNNKGNLVIDRKLKVGFDVPKSVNMNIKIPTQKYKNRCVYSY
ncbi:MAG TPA: hypothetical protein DIU30_05660 [Clostridiales bacterium]|jgi:hypothetical protein|nr:hypothetical protein [Clostridiales bacterium]